MGNCLSHSAPGGVQAQARHSGGEQPDQLLIKADAGKDVVAAPAKPAALPEPVEPKLGKEEEPVLEDLAKPGEVPNAVINPETDLILNMLDPENGPAAGLPYQVHYLGPPRPPCESERLATVQLLGKMNDSAPPDPEISCILKLVANVFKAPAALCALFDEQRVFISEQEGDVIPCGAFPWRWTLCGWSMAFKNPQVLVIQDTLQDQRFRNNEKVTVFPKVRFYCGAPLVASNGHRLGTLCFADVKPRKFDMASCVMMNNLSELVVRQLEKDIAIKIKEKANKQLLDTFRNLQRAVDCYEQCVVLLDTSEEGWKIMYANAAWSKQTGMPRDHLVGSTLHEVLEATDGTALPSPALLKAARDLKSAKVQLARIKDASITKGFTLTFRPAGRQVLDESTIPIGVPSFLSLDEGEDDVAHRFYFMTIAAPGASKRSSVNSFGMGVPASLLSSYSSSSALLLDPHSTVGSSILNAARDNNSMQGLELAHLLGRGSFGWVYYGLWYGTPVAVKIIDEDIRPSAANRAANCSMGSKNNSVYGSCHSASSSHHQDGSGAGGGLVPHLEALMAHELRHPNIVATLKYGTHMVPYGRAPDLEDYVGGGGGNASHLSTASFPISSAAQLLPDGLSVTPNREHNTAGMAAALSTAMVTANSCDNNAAAAGAMGAGGNGCGGGSLLSSSAEDHMVTAQTCDPAALPAGWVVIDAAAGAAPTGTEGFDSSEQPEEQQAQHTDGEEDKALSTALRVRPEAWRHLAPASGRANNKHLGSPQHSNNVALSGSSACMTGPTVGAGGGNVRDSAATIGAGASDVTSGPAAVATMALRTRAAAAQPAQNMMKQTWMVMEFCDRGTVQDAIDRGWLRTERDCLHSEPNWLAVVATAYDVASALQYLHAHDVVHGDLTGWNVMLSSSGAGSTLGGRGFVAKVADFGLSRCMEMRTQITTKTYGTLSHMPPELLSQGLMSKAVDVYSFGVLLWQMYTGSRPWSGLTHAQIIVKVVQEHQRLHWGNDAMPAFRQLAEACMSYNAESRPGFAAIVETLDALRTSLSP